MPFLLAQAICAAETLPDKNHSVEVPPAVGVKMQRPIPLGLQQALRRVPLTCAQSILDCCTRAALSPTKS
jgi:hypothetical protein